ncbi:MAG: hypothetical protein ACXAEU_14985 [Candidatus Hodarchaeales archaeon]|jgi:hypothetical protein
MALKFTTTWKRPLEIVFDLNSGQRTFYANTTALIVIRQTLSGPAPLPSGDKKLPFATEKTEEVMTKLGMFYQIAVGQGDCYAEGMYGPLPALDSEYHCLIYASTAVDPQQKDPRMKGWTYLITCFFYHSALEPRMMERRGLLEQLFADFYNARQHVEKIVTDIPKLKKRIKNYILE